MERIFILNKESNFNFNYNNWKFIAWNNSNGLQQKKKQTKEDQK
jgi:hypothetical protein